MVIFNTILISYVRRSKLNKQCNSEGVELRRHNRGNQCEQRKTTIMLSKTSDHSLPFFYSILFLVAVVIVFTVCQIPQAISLTLQSFFPTLARTPKVLIYNNFANCLVAVNASINFLLYCCFSDRFRSTFRSNFTFLSKYCAQYVHPKWETPSRPYSASVDNISTTNPVNTRISSLSVDFNPKYLTHIHHKSEGKNPSWFSRFSSPTKAKKSPHISKFSIPTLHTRPKYLSDIQQPLISSANPSPIREKSLSLRELDQRRNKSILYPKSSSYRSLNGDTKSKDQIWIKRRLSHSTIEELLNRGNSFPSKEIIDVTV